MDPDREPLDADPNAARGSFAPRDPAPSAGAPAAQQPAAGTDAPSSAPTAPREPEIPGAEQDVDVATLDPADTLSPAVRRLVRQYDLDITGIHGTGPAGKIRVGDVIGLLGGRADPAARGEDPVRTTAVTGDDAGGERAASSPPGGVDDNEQRTEMRASSHAARFVADSAHAAPPTTTVFECDLSRVLSHRKRGRRNDSELLLTSYFLAALDTALHGVPEIAADGGARAGAPVPGNDGVRAAARLGVLLSAADGGARRTLVVATESDLDERLRTIDRQLRVSGDGDLSAAELLIHHYGLSGSLLATPTEIGAGHAASVGIGRVRREIVVKTVDGEEAPRVAALCYVTLTFAPERVTLGRANRFVAELVRVLEQWPLETTAV